MNKAIFLDRDGTINIDKDYLYRIEDFEYMPGAVDGLKKLSEMGYILIIVTNQSGIARGIYKEDDYSKLDKWLKSDLLEKGIRISASYYCPHLPGGIVRQYAKECKCRKPATGLFWKAVKEFNIDLDNSIAIGDKLRDLSICNESNAKGILLSSVADSNYNYLVCKDWSEIIAAVEEF